MMTAPEAEAQQPPAPKMSMMLLGALSIVMLYGFQALFYYHLVPGFEKMFFVKEIIPPAPVQRFIDLSNSIRGSSQVAVPFLFALAAWHAWSWLQPSRGLHRLAVILTACWLGLSLYEISVFWYYILHLNLLAAAPAAT